MSSVDRQQWQALLALDADTLAELAGPGLLRRAGKDLAEGRVVALPAAGAFEVDGQRVQLDARGWQQAQCGCPAPAWCKHKLAAILALQQGEGADCAPRPIEMGGPHAEAAGGSEAEPDTELAPHQTVPPSADGDLTDASPSNLETALLAEIDALDPTECLRLAGSAARQRLPRLLAQIDGLSWSARPGSLRVELAGLEQAVSYLRHGGWAGMHVEGSAASQAALKLAALWAVWRRRGRALPAPDGAIGKSRSAPSDDQAGHAQDAGERQLLALVLEQLHGWLEEGLAHLSPGRLDRMALLAVDARAAGLPALAGRLRQLQQDGQRLRARDDQIDEGAVLAQLARCQAWCEAMSIAAEDRQRALAGGPRRFVEQDFERELLVAGAHWWTRPSGARGLNVLFWDVQARRLRRCSVARSDGSDTGFTPHAAWNAPLWPGAGSPQRLLEVGSVSLQRARLSASGDLAPAHALAAPGSAPGSAGPPPGIDDWSLLGEQLLAEIDLYEARSPYLLLAPSKLAPLQLDELQQCFRWPLFDRHGSLLQASWPCGEQHERDHRVLTYWAELPGRKCLLLACSESPRPSLQPVSLLQETGGRWRCHTLQYDQPPKRVSLATLGGRIARLLAERRSPPVAPRSRLQSDLLDPLSERLARLASAGRMDPRSGGVAELADGLEAAGLAQAGAAWRQWRDGDEADRASGLLRLVWLIDNCSRLLSLRSLLASS